MTHIDSKRHDLPSLKDVKKLSKEAVDLTVKCKHCGHSIVMPHADRTICSWCGRWVYRTPKIEFKFKLMKEIKEGKC